MNEKQKFNFSTVFLYILCFTAMFCLYYVGDNGEPFSLALLYAMLSCGLHPVVSCLLYCRVGTFGLFYPIPARLCGTGGDFMYPLLRIQEA